MNQYGGYLQGQYWFTNQWFLNATWGFIRDYGFDTSTSGLLAGQATATRRATSMPAHNDQVEAVVGV